MIYFDNAATAAPPVLWPEQYFGNPSSPHKLGLRAERSIGNARSAFAKILNCRESEIIFTSGGTESNNLAIIGFAMAHRRQDTGVFAEPWEHPSVIEPIGFIKEQSLAESYIAPVMAKKTFSHALQLISISQVCHETGTINDVASIAKSIKKDHPKAVIHVDGAQGFCKESVDLSDIDMYSFSAHKCHGPQGVGGLMVRGGIRLAPLMYGGGQEKGQRPGTENVAGITMSADTAERLYHSLEVNHNHVTNINTVIKSIQDDLPDVLINSRSDAVTPYILNMSFSGINGETLVHLLSEKGIYASMGAACRSRKKVKTALEQMGFDQQRAKSAVRFSFSHLNTLEEATEAKAIIIDAVKQLRRMIR